MSTTSGAERKTCPFCNRRLATHKETITIEDAVFIVEMCAECHALRKHESHLSICTGCGMIVMAKKTWLYLYLSYYPLHKSWSIVPSCPLCSRDTKKTYWF